MSWFSSHPCWLGLMLVVRSERTSGKALGKSRLLDPTGFKLISSLTPSPVSNHIFNVRKLEDKLQNHKIELRPFTINISLEDLHKNREMPGAYLSFLGVADSTLPLRGTAHRSVRGTPESEHQTNMWLGVSLLCSPNIFNHRAPYPKHHVRPQLCINKYIYIYICINRNRYKYK